ncbi:MAG TPA: hypothetical protein VFZ59_27835 [Verrucomicrobiae bacterium]|nr:hypothetical protein [Verrucomicrobiae bacterium]
MNISATSWPKTSVAKATRHDRATLGGEFGQGRLVTQSRYGLIPNPDPGKQVTS